MPEICKLKNGTESHRPLKPLTLFETPCHTPHKPYRLYKPSQALNNPIRAKAPVHSHKVARHPIPGPVAAFAAPGQSAKQTLRRVGFARMTFAGLGGITGLLQA